MAIAASFAMLAMSATGPGLAHLGNETLGAMAGLAHGRATGLLLPEVMDFNLMTDPAKFAAIAELMGEDTTGLSDIEAGEMAIEAVRRLLFDLGMPQTLTEVGVTEDKIPELGQRACRDQGPGRQDGGLPGDHDRPGGGTVYQSPLGQFRVEDWGPPTVLAAASFRLVKWTRSAIRFAAAGTVTSMDHQNPSLKRFLSAVRRHWWH